MNTPLPIFDKSRMPPTSNSTRREFVKGSAAAVALGALTSPCAVHASGSNSDVLRLGLIGCGGRGIGAVHDALAADQCVELVAIGDVFADRVQEALALLKRSPDVKSRIKVTPDLMFPAKDNDFDSYKHVIDSDIDVVILATPPHFRPQHLAYAVDKGKHCFVEKPVAVDVPGVRSAQHTCRVAQAKNLSVVAGLVFRADPGIIETVKRVQDGAIGEIIAIQACRNGGSLWHRGDNPAWSRMEYQIRNWLYYTWLSGDHITEQAVHTLDKVNWLLGDPSPLMAMGMGGRQQRTGAKWGNIYDHHTVFIEYPNGVKCFFTCRQQSDTTFLADELVLGTKGRAWLTGKRIEGSAAWRYRGKPVDAFRREHENLFASIRSGTALNQGDYLCNSTLTSIMGRLCTYSGRDWKWNDVLANEERLGPGVYEWIDVPEPPVAIPGVTAS